ncbi:MAG: DUF3383 family protein [Clostridium sp.]|nr:DUF3383 family protein [Clostridium sp.]
MSIPITKYVAITSTVGGQAAAARKDLIARVLTTNPLFAANTVYEFTSSANVADFAGSLSPEAKFASEYFGWISKKANQAKKISFMRYSFEALAPYMYSTKELAPIAEFKAVTDGSMVVNLGGTAYTLTGVNLSAVEDYASTAAAIQTAIRANADGGSLWTNATVTYNATNSCFQLTGGETGKNEINYAQKAESGTDLATLIGWDTAGAPVLSNGTAEQTITDVLNKTIDLSTNFLTFGFLNPADAYANLDLVGAWTSEQNNNYRFCFDLGKANYTEGIATAAKYEGMTAHYNINYGIEGINPAWIMAAILPATTNYNQKNAVKNYMFQEFPQQAISVGNDDDTLYQTLDNLCINYNGQTQKSGKTIAFYQNGFNADGMDSAIFDNEAWFKDAVTTDALNAFMAHDFISADNDGRAIMCGVLENNCDEALKNHVFSQGKELNNTQKAYITQLIGDENAWLTVQNNGYTYQQEITTEVQGNTTIFIWEYLLVYLKNDVIRKVVGRNILI